MAANDCIDAINKATNNELSEDELVDLIETYQEKLREIRTENDLLSDEAAAMEAADALQKSMEQAALLKKRHTYLNFRRRMQAWNYIKENWSDNPSLGIESFLVGTNVSRVGSRYSVDAEQKQLSQSYLGGMLNELEKGDLLNIVDSEAVDLDIAKAMFELNKEEPDFKGLDANAVEAAKVFRKYQEISRIDANRAGAAIGKRDDYMVKQSHDPYKIRAHGDEEWKADMLQWLDPATFKGANPDEFLTSAYTALDSGVHLKHIEPGEQKPNGFKGPRNLAKSISAERTLHFKDAESWFAYNQKYGANNVREAVFGSIELLAHRTALMRKLGPNAEANLEQIMDMSMNLIKDDPNKRRKFAEDTDKDGMLWRRYRAVDGSMNVPVNQTLAKWSAYSRSWTNMTKLGGATVSAISDLPIAASEMTYQGQSFLGSMGGLLDGLVKGRKKIEQREMLADLGIYFESMRGAIINRFSADDQLGGKMSRAQFWFFKANLLNWWTESMRSSAALMMSQNLGRNAAKSFDDLGDLSRVMSLYGIDKTKWDLLREYSVKSAEDGKAFMVAEGIDGIPDDVIKPLLRVQNQAAINEFKTELTGALRAFISDRASYAVIEPDARTKSMMRQNTRPGTINGEIMRFIGQFKAFPWSVIQKSMGRELYGRGYIPTEYGTTLAPMKELIQALRHGNGEKRGFAALIAWTTAFGYLAMSAKDMLKGRTPRDPSAKSTWVAAMLQGGALGIYGDFLFGEANRFGGGAIQTTAGPVLGSAEDLLGLFHRARQGLLGDEDADFLSAAMRFGIDNTPFINLFYTRMALDYLFIYHLQEAMNPGYLRRMERRVERDNAQTFLVSPSEVVR